MVAGRAGGAHVSARLAAVALLLCALAGGLAGGGRASAGARRTTAPRAVRRAPARLLRLRGGQDSEWWAWNAEVLQQCVRELKHGGRLKHFIDGLYVPSASQPAPHAAACAADAINPTNRFATAPDPDDESAAGPEERAASWAHF